MKRVLIAISLFYFPIQEKCIAQFSEQLDSMCMVCNRSTSVSEKLSNLYGKLDDFKNAFQFSKKANTYNEIIRSQSKQNEITLLGVDRENVKHQQELLLQQQKENLSRNIQLVVITFALIIIIFKRHLGTFFCAFAGDETKRHDNHQKINSFFHFDLFWVKKN